MKLFPCFTNEKQKQVREIKIEETFTTPKYSMNGAKKSLLVERKQTKELE